jgi:flagellin-like protein
MNLQFGIGIYPHNKNKVYKMEKLRINMKNKKAVSPIVATVLLIMIVIVLAIIILIWSRGFMQEIITKQVQDQDKRLDEWCHEIKIEGLINDDGTFGVINNGQIPIFAFNLKTVTGGDSNTERISESLNPTHTQIVNKQMGNYDSIKLIPILLGSTDKGSTQEKSCPESNALIIK